MKKKEFDLREKKKAAIVEAMKNLAKASEDLSSLVFGNVDRTIVSMVSLPEHIDKTLDESHVIANMILETEKSFRMDSIVHSPDSINLLRKMAEDYVEEVKKMDLDEMLDSTDGYSNIRRIYERRGDYLYPRRGDEKEKERLALYGEFNLIAGDLFRAELERYYDVEGLSQKAKDRLYSKAYEDGHASGFSEIRNYYDDLVGFYKEMVS